MCYWVEGVDWCITRWRGGMMQCWVEGVVWCITGWIGALLVGRGGLVRAYFLRGGD